MGVADTAVFNALAAALNAPDNDRRGMERYEYPVYQLLAPYDGSRPPDRSEFREVLCNDMSRGGISFFLASPPSFERAVMALGSPTRFIYVVVRVRNSRPDARRGYVVGCEFEGLFETGQGKSDD